MVTFVLLIKSSVNSIKSIKFCINKAFNLARSVNFSI